MNVKLNQAFELLEFDDIDPHKEYDCPVCDGLKKVRVEEFNPESTRYNDYEIDCPECNGTGKIIGEQLQDKLA